MNNITNLYLYIICLFFSFIFIHPNNAFAEDKKRYVLEDRKIDEISILPFSSKDKNSSERITKIFYDILLKNKSSIKVNNKDDKLKFGSHNLNERINSQLNRTYLFNKEKKSAYIYGNIKTFYSEVKTINISDFIDYNIFEHQVKIEIELFVVDSDNNELLWKRKYSKYNFHDWINFLNPKIGSNNIISLFYAPDNLNAKLYRKYTEDEFINLQIIQIVTTLMKNLCKI